MGITVLVIKIPKIGYPEFLDIIKEIARQSYFIHQQPDNHNKERGGDPKPCKGDRPLQIQRGVEKKQTP